MIEAAAAVLIALGFLFFFATSVGIIRFPDFYCRMHAAGKGDTLSTVLILSGLALLNLEHFSGGALLVSVKIVFIAVFIFLASPAASHAILDAGYHSGTPPWSRTGGSVPAPSPSRAAAGDAAHGPAPASPGGAEGEEEAGAGPGPVDPGSAGEGGANP